MERMQRKRRKREMMDPRAGKIDGGGRPVLWIERQRNIRDKMPSRNCQNMQVWFMECIQEKTDCMEEEEMDQYTNETLAGIQRLRDECNEFLGMAMGEKADDTLADVIMNSVDWEDLLSDLRQYYASNHEWVSCQECRLNRIGEADECVRGCKKSVALVE
jgi:hypothetical protein